MKRAVTLLIAGLILIPGIPATADFDHTHARLDTLLKKNVMRGLVNYRSLKDDHPALAGYLQGLSAVREDEFAAFDREQQLAFLINAYNAFTLELILQHYPLKSISEIGGPVAKLNLLRGAPWKFSFFTLLGQKRTLDWIEHGMLRAKYDEPRIHFAINCASRGCPALPAESFQAPRLEKQLNTAFRTFMADATKNRIDHSKKKIMLSKIFDWFKKDFEKKAGSVRAFVQAGFAESVPADYGTAYTDYDWSLNEI